MTWIYEDAFTHEFAMKIGTYKSYTYKNGTFKLYITYIQLVPVGYETKTCRKIVTVICLYCV